MQKATLDDPSGSKDHTVGWTARSVFINAILLASTVPPRFLGKGAQVDFVSPRRAMLLRQMVVRVCDTFGQQETVMRHATVFPERLKALGAEQLAQGVRRINKAIDEDMNDVNPAGRVFRVERLT